MTSLPKNISPKNFVLWGPLKFESAPRFALRAPASRVPKNPRKKKMAPPEQPHRAEPADGSSSEDRIARRHPVSVRKLRSLGSLLRPAEHITGGRGNVKALLI